MVIAATAAVAAERRFRGVARFEIDVVGDDEDNCCTKLSLVSFTTPFVAVADDVEKDEGLANVWCGGDALFASSLSVLTKREVP